VRPSPIRTEADELTYNLHVLLRFELEVALFEGDLSVADLPEAWNAKTREYLGFTPETDVSGVLQDTHWALGLFGYFPTYATGNVLSVQIFEAAVEDRPEIPAEMARGEFGALLGWLRENIHRHGSRYEPGRAGRAGDRQAVRDGPVPALPGDQVRRALRVVGRVDPPRSPYSSTQVSFELPPALELTTRVPGLATRVRPPAMTWSRAGSTKARRSTKASPGSDRPS
jgi:hypothetical protein